MKFLTSERVIYLTNAAPLALALVALLVGGALLLVRADHQARDTTRKHHLEDLEKALFFAREVHGTFPPYDQATWCGVINDPANSNVLSQIEEALRTQNEKYENPEKPFPIDPQQQIDKPGYFYWKRSPAVFELYSILETDSNGERNTLACSNAPDIFYDYGLNSAVREKQINHLL